MKTYDGGGVLKRHVRTELLRHATEHFKGDVRYLGLPADNLGFERAMMAFIPSLSMTGFEHNPAVAERARRLALDLCIPISLTDGDIHNAKGEYNFAWFDYCGCLDADKVVGLTQFIQNNLYFNGQDNPIVAITLLRGRERRPVWEMLTTEHVPLAKRKLPLYARAYSPGVKSAIRIQKRMADHVTSRWQGLRRKVFPEKLNAAAAETGRHFQVIRHLEYTETSPMLLMIGHIGEGVKPLASPEVEVCRRR